MSSGFSPEAQVRPTTHAEVLLAVATKIRSNVQSLGTENICFVSDTPEPSVEVNDNLFATVCPSDGQFDNGIIDGAGNVGVTELSPVIVTIFSRIEVDQIEHFQQGFTDVNRGLLTIKRQVLMALSGKNLDGGQYNGFGSLLLLEALTPSRSRHPLSKQRDDEFASCGLVFDAKFHWDLGSTSSIT